MGDKVVGGKVDGGVWASVETTNITRAQATPSWEANNTSCYLYVNKNNAHAYFTCTKFHIE